MNRPAPSRDTSDRWTPPISTPTSSSIFTFSQHGGSQCRFEGIPGLDMPVPSLEDATNDPASSSSRSIIFAPPSSSRSPSARTPTPSIALSTPPTSSAMENPQGTASGVDDIIPDIRALQLEQSEKPLNLGHLTAALPRASPSTVSPAPLPHTHASGGQSESPRPPTARNRRSSSRTNLTAHNVRDEELPGDRFHEPAFQQAFHNARVLMGNLARVLGSSALHLDPDSTIQDLERKAQNLANFQCPPTRVVGLVGDSGAGKSSLLNALLDIQGLARVSGNAAACTCVVTEYRYHEADNFIIDVEEFSNHELKQQFTEMVRNYRHSHFHSAEIRQDGDGPQWASLAKLACDTFEAMFRGRFHPSVLTSGQQEQVVETLLGWARERSSVAGQKIAPTFKECSAQLIWLTSEETSPQGPAVWPYIKKISVFLNAYILSKGLVLVDLPGLRDLNSARRVITERHLLNCNEIFAICSIIRAITDEGVMAVFGLARQARLSNVGIICTRSDDIHANEAKLDWSDEVAMRILELMDSVEEAKRSLADMNERVTELEGFGDDLLDGEEAEKTELYRNRDKQRTVVENHEAALQRYLITNRNALAIAKLTEQYRFQIPGSNLSVFCASNTMYWKHRHERPSERALPFLQLSGIIGIRKHCMALVSESQLRIALKYMLDDIPDLISRVELWVQSGAGSVDAEQRQIVRTELNALEDQLRKKMRERESPLQALSNLLARDFNENIYRRRNISRWTQGAMSAGLRWSYWNHGTYAAFCRHNGIHTTAKAGYHNWNEEAIEAMTRDLSDPWSTFQQLLRDRAGIVATFINEAFGPASEHLTSLPGEYSDSISSLHDGLSSCQRQLGTEVEDLCDQFEGKVSKLRTNALSGLETAFFSQGMEQAYAGAQRISGTGSWAGKKSIINGRLAQEEQFRALMRRFRDGFGDLAAALQAEIQTKVRERLDVIAGILDIIRSEAAAEESERDPGFRMRVAEEIQAVKAAMEEIRATIE
ncbi:hypothetical protein B0H63DRAFT_490012 [Podospora didyma]|uniref:Nuclear GTPase SLIP-GC n=1 Tax=Podospora didyma TaxID=330526 RepID=A0AAE0K1K9_9PEZI|nr:hypothetical protein B0H63DRAFT_490012 [Podospora didyma]